LPFQNVIMYGKTTGAAYARLFIAEIFPELERCLYLDADILCRKPLAPLWNLDLGEAVLGAALDPTFFEVEAFLEIFGGRYFNSGVLLIDLVQWRRMEMTRRAIDAVNFFEANALPNQYWDQSPLNLALRGAFRPLAPRWNMSIHHRSGMHGFYGCTPDEFETQRSDPAIFHFLGNEKPWRAEFAGLNEHFRDWQKMSLDIS
jgi:lipopolysaccharide biosynthesis glycosyltransferase